jgi:hypothetical protein
MRCAVMTKRSRIDNLTDEQWYEFLPHVYSPWVRLAEKVGDFKGEFEVLRNEKGGFDPEIRYILDQDLKGDREATKLKRSIPAAMKRMWRMSCDSSAPSMDQEWLHFFSSRPFSGTSGASGAASLVRGDDFDTRLGFFFFPIFSEFGFTRDRGTSTRDEWSCETEVEGYQVRVTFEKDHPPSYRASGSIFLVEFGRAIPLAYPFFFSGGPHFNYSKADNLTAELDQFFGAYRKIINSMWAALTESLAAGDDYLRTVERSSV